MRFKLKKIESVNDFSVSEILTFNGIMTGYAAEKNKDDGETVWKLKNMQSKMWKKFRTKREMFRTLERIKTDSDYAKKFKDESDNYKKFRLKEIYSCKKFSVAKILTAKGRRTGYNAAVVRNSAGDSLYWRLINARSGGKEQFTNFSEMLHELEYVRANPAYAKKYKKLKNHTDTKTLEEKKEDRKWRMREIRQKIGFAMCFILCAIGVVSAAVSGFDVFLKSPLFKVLLGILAAIGILNGFWILILILFFWPLAEVVKIMFGL